MQVDRASSIRGVRHSPQGKYDEQATIAKRNHDSRHDSDQSFGRSDTKQRCCQIGHIR